MLTVAKLGQDSAAADTDFFTGSCLGSLGLWEPSNSASGSLAC